MRKVERGFTLMELLIAVAIVSILAAIALPSYRNQVIRSNRNIAKSDLLTLQQWMERNYSLSNRYDKLPDGTTTVTISSLPYSTSPQSGTKNYDISFATNPALSASTYQLIATPTAGTTQALDTACGAITLDQAGVHGATISGTLTTGNVTAVNDCWNR